MNPDKRYPLHDQAPSLNTADPDDRYPWETSDDDPDDGERALDAPVPYRLADLHDDARGGL